MKVREAAFVAFKTALLPQSISGSSDVNGVSIDKRALSYGNREAIVDIFAGAVGGTPDSFTVTVRVQDSANGSSWANVTDTDIADAAVVISAANGRAQIGIRLESTRQYVRIVALPAFVNGTSPSVLLAASLLLAAPERV